MSSGLHVAGATDGATDVRASESRASGVNAFKVKVYIAVGSVVRASDARGSGTVSCLGS